MKQELITMERISATNNLHNASRATCWRKPASDCAARRDMEVAASSQPTHSILIPALGAGGGMAGPNGAVRRWGRALDGRIRAFFAGRYGRAGGFASAAGRECDRCANPHHLAQSNGVPVGQPEAAV